MAKRPAAWFRTGTLYRIGPLNVAWWRYRHRMRMRMLEKNGAAREARPRLRYALLLVLTVPLGALADRHPVPTVPTGHDLYRLPLAAFRAYVGGIHDGQNALAKALGIQPIVCLDVHMTRNDLAGLVLYALPKLPSEVMDLPAGNVVFRVLIDNARCPDLQGKPRQ